VSVERGDCTKKGGSYYNGTIDTKSFVFNAGNGELSFSYTNGDVIGSGTISGLSAPPTDPLPPGVGPMLNGVGRNTGPFVDTLSEILKFGASLAFPLTGLAVDLAAGVDTQRDTAQAALSRKPGSLGRFKGTDALRRENKIARDIIKRLHLTGKNAEAVHGIISEASIDAGRQLTFRELIPYVKNVLGLL
jgi:hypothetical protein